MAEHRFMHQYHELREAAKEHDVSTIEYIWHYIVGLAVVAMFFITIWVLKLGNALL